MITETQVLNYRHCGVLGVAGDGRATLRALTADKSLCPRQVSPQQRWRDARISSPRRFQQGRQKENSEQSARSITEYKL